MKLLFLLVVCVVASLDARRVLKCGRIQPGCVTILDDGNCPTHDLCPIGLKRRVVGSKCCCVLKASKDFPKNFESAKRIILKETLELIKSTFQKLKNRVEEESDRSVVEKLIDESSKSISDAMMSGTKKLANLVDIEYFKVMSFVFEENESDFNGRIRLVSNEVGRIYAEGESAFNSFQKIIEKL